jgi:CheY-like chemotaxis protein
MAKILLIDDDPDVRVVMSRVLQQEGYEVETAGSRDEALLKIAGGIPSLILLDVLLSGADGRELCRELKGGEQTGQVPVIMFSGHPGAAQNFQSWGADDFIAKPFTSEALLEKLSRRLTS